MVFRLRPGKQTPECDLGRPSIAEGKELHFEKSRIKTISVAFFDSRGLIRKEFVPTG